MQLCGALQCAQPLPSGVVDGAVGFDSQELEQSRGELLLPGLNYRLHRSEAQAGVFVTEHRDQILGQGVTLALLANPKGKDADSLDAQVE